MIFTEEVIKTYGVSDKDSKDILAFLSPIRVKDFATYRHCLRVGGLAARIGEHMHLDGRALLFAGLLHDVGKCLTHPNTLDKTEKRPAPWTEEDAKEIEAHVADGFRMLRGRFDFSAQIVAWHHQFQKRPYPKEPLPQLHDYSAGSEVMISMYGRLLALADTYDAFHRSNYHEGSLTKLSDVEIRDRMYAAHPDQKIVLDGLYAAGVLR